jgi:hypothetical protein
VPEQLPPDDPITSRPMAGLVLISVFILMLTVSWSLYDEFYGLRPWRSYQGEFSKAYSAFLEKQYAQRKGDEQKFYSTPQYLKLTADIKAATDAAAGTTAAEVDLSKIELPADVAAVVEGEAETEAGLPKKRLTRTRKAVVKAE